MAQISLAPEVVFEIGNFDVTNTLFTGFVVFFLVVVFFAWFASNSKAFTPSKFQLVVEGLIMLVYDLVLDILGRRRGKKLFGFIFTFFVFILFSNWFGLIMLMFPVSVDKNIEQTVDHNVIAAASSGEEYAKESGELDLSTCLEKGDKCYLTLDGLEVFEHSVHLFRPPTTDLSAALGLAFVSVLATNIIGFAALKLDYVKKFLYVPNVFEALDAASKANGILKSIGVFLRVLFNDLVKTFVGILEIISEVGKLLSFSFRLVGNIFAGEILLAVLTSITFGLATLPFLGLEIFIGFIQAIVFAMLTTVFIGIAVIPHDEDH